MLTSSQINQIKALIRASLNRAEDVWKKNGLLLEKADTSIFASDHAMERADSQIPGYEEVKLGEEKVDTFIAMVADIRGSSNHLRHDSPSPKVTSLQRVYYETSALLPALELTVSFYGGSTTEYLGDGILSMFQVKDKDEVIREAYRAGRDCINHTLSLVNSELASRYELPKLNIGIGLGMSEALVSLVGLPRKFHPKAIGRCVYNASKLSTGMNEIYVDERMWKEWPSEKGGTLKFAEVTIDNGLSGYRVITKPLQGKQK